MKFKNRKLYSHGQNDGIFLIQIPKVISDDMELTKNASLLIEYKDYKMVITKEKEQEQCQETT